MDRDEFDGRYGKVIDDKFYVICDPDALLYLPKNITIPGDLILPDGGLYDLPAGLTVEGDLDLGGTSIYTVWSNLTVEGTLTLTGSHVTKLPDHVSAGRLELKNSTVIEIGEYLKVESDLDLSGTEIIKIGAHFTVKGSLLLCASKLENFSEDSTLIEQYLNYGDDIKIQDSFPLYYEPKFYNLVVEDVLDLSGSKIRKIPDYVCAGRVQFSNSNIEEIGSYFNLKDDLLLDASRVESIGDHLRVDGTLYLTSSKVKHLPAYVEVRNILATSSELLKISDHLEVHFSWFSHNKDCLDLSNTKIKELGNHTFVDGSLDLSNTEISSLPSHLWVGGRGYNIENIKNHGARA